MLITPIGVKTEAQGGLVMSRVTNVQALGSGQLDAKVGAILFLKDTS